MNNSHMARLMTLTLVSLGTGCASVYTPQTLGTLGEGTTPSELRVTIYPDDEIAIVGDPIRFSVEVENVTSHDVWIPQRPDILFMWIFSDGTRDNYLFDFAENKFYQKDDLIRLSPSEARSFEVPVKTGYFTRMGITEFRAMFRMARNTNPAIDGVWNGDVYSNCYGLMVTQDRNMIASRSSEHYADLR